MVWTADSVQQIEASSEEVGLSSAGMARRASGDTTGLHHRLSGRATCIVKYFMIIRSLCIFY